MTRTARHATVSLHRQPGHRRQAEALLEAHGERVTPARARVVAALIGAGQPLTHREIEQVLGPGEGVDRVTVYRVLEWLESQGLAHKVAGDDRVWRYKLGSSSHPSGHAHFMCSRCGGVFCLEDMATAFALSLPRGFRSRQVELTIRGLCAQCAGA
jgi:Fur family ferric uptake transcriptional regulator